MPYKREFDEYDHHFGQSAPIQLSEKEQYELKKREVLDKFIDAYRRFNFDPSFRPIVELLMRDHNPYEIIEKLLDHNQEYRDLIKQYVTEFGPLRGGIKY
jgi:hypothetical protein